MITIRKLISRGWKTPKQVPIEEEEQLTTQKQEVDFVQIVDTLTPLSKSAQMTFLYRYIKTLSPNMCRTLLKYVHEQIRNLHWKKMEQRLDATDRTERSRENPQIL